jgi:hypothetical protein
MPARLESEGAGLVAGIRPEAVEVFDAETPGAFAAALELAEPSGDRTLLTLRVGEERLRAFAPPRTFPERLFARPDPARLHFFSAETERRLEPL